MEKSKNYNFNLPNSANDEIADINDISDNFRIIDKIMNETDQTFKPTSTKAASGKAVNEAISGIQPIDENTEFIFDGGDVDGGVSVDIVVDTVLSKTSNNPIANKPVAIKFGEILGAIDTLKDIVHIVESGTDGIWSYRKWSDGTAECWGVSAVSVTCTNEEGVYFSDSKSIALPSNLFNEDPIALAACGDPWCWVSNVGASRSAVHFKVTRGNNYSNTLSTGINLCVIGRWK